MHHSRLKTKNSFILYDNLILILDLNGESKTVAVYPLVPPAWKHSFNLTVLAGAGDSNDMQCFISSFIKGAAFITIKVQAKKILFKILSLGYKSYPIQFDQTYSIEVELRYQGVSSTSNPPQTEWNMEIKIDGAKFFEEVKTNLINYNDVVYIVGFGDVYCKDNIRIQDLKFTPLFNEGSYCIFFSHLEIFTQKLTFCS